MHDEKVEIWTEFPLKIKETPETQKQLCPQYSSNSIVFHKISKYPNIQTLFKQTSISKHPKQDKTNMKH